MRVYRGFRSNIGAVVTVDGCKPLPLCLNLARHSPTGFEWGYCGSGPSQLALALLSDHLNDDRAALALYQEFKFAVVASLPAEWTLTSEQVAAHVDQLRAAQVSA